VLVIGVAPFTYVIYETVFTIETMFHHSNVRLPLGFERWLNKIVVTPRMHGVHHSAVRGETNPNYNVIFSWWDRLHRTLVLNVPQLSIRIGVPGYQNPQDNRFWNLLRLPFIRQKEYWRFPDGTLPRSNQDNTYSASRLSE
jgi:sterol desaturase/sphingolipid hydroxylase (fatty acid hydroxylase superfamily)